jgi:hypothetical protein
MAVTDERVSRRRLLKRAGIGAAALGAGSMLTASSAGAQPHHGDQACIDAGGCAVCNGQQSCGSDCFCSLSVDGCCSCYQNYFCDGAPTCHHNSDCPPGWACLTTCCSVFGYGMTCAAPCGFNEVAAQGSGPMAGGGGGAASESEPETPKKGHGGPKHG